ncbi:hypothetical protein AB0B66_07755 [Catellatospora sp. NPDC049111]|uniref:hypothetical protein n=1 Tax=Catellatospora sp. NPDC049111 TaxID=3155271 RepID=UPI0033C08404
MSVRAGRIAGADLVSTVTRDDLVPEWADVVSRGWTVSDRAVLLGAWYMSYHGDRSSFSETMDYEAAVNGRGIPDLDLTVEGQERAAMLLRRGVAFAWAALHEQHRQLPEVEVAAYISSAGTLVDPDHFTGNVTFCAVRPGQPPYIDPAQLTDDIVVSIATGDCVGPLPHRRRS